MTLTEARATYRAIGHCRACGHDKPMPVLSLGMIPISDFPANPSAPVDSAPLELERCAICGLVQLAHSVDRERLYSGYWYQSSTNEVMRAELGSIVATACKLVPLDASDAVLDIGANDGTLLGVYSSSVHRVAVEPSSMAERIPRGITIVPDFFPSTRFPVEKDGYKHIHSIAMFYDLDKPDAFVAAIKRCLAPGGVWVLQMAMLDNMLDVNGFDNICHEHVAYWDHHSLYRLLRAHDLGVTRTEHTPINGGSWRFFIQHEGKNSQSTPSVPPITNAQIERFVKAVPRIAQISRDMLEQDRDFGLRVYGYGASTKGNTFLNVCGIGPDLIKAFAERSPQKVGRFTTNGIPIVSEDEMRQAEPDYLLLGAWQFADAFAMREKALLASGTKFIVPLPWPHLRGG